MVPFLVSATTPHGVVLSRPWGIALDGLLASVLWHRRKWAARQSGQHVVYRSADVPDVIELPLARCGDPETDADWHWACTFADLHFPDNVADEPDIRWRTSRTDHQRLQALAPKVAGVSDKSGRYQRRLIPVMAHTATMLTWRGVGDPDRIRDLLCELPAIGKHTGTGEGVVTGWEVTTTPAVDRWSAGHEHAPGILGRTSPTRCITGPIQAGPLTLGAVRPPYLHPASRVRAFQPAR